MPSETQLTLGYRLRSDVVLRDLFRLVATYLAMEPMNDLSDGEPDAFTDLFYGHAEDEIIRSLINTAISNRLQLEHMARLRGDEVELSFEPVVGNCGTIWREPNLDETSSLTFREACNKIIHAEEVIHLDPAKPIIDLKGIQGKRRWTAQVEIIKYARLTSINFNTGIN